jgi:hypothetical protein
MTKCELCSRDVEEDEVCIFATYKVNIDGKMVSFCCTRYAKGYIQDDHTGQGEKESVRSKKLDSTQDSE